MKKYRLYYDKDKEIAWLNKMCDRGYAMKKFVMGMYFFEPCEPGQYRYQIDLLPEGNAEITQFLDLMREIGIEVVDTWVAWVYLRRDSAQGEFELYSDTAGKIAQYSRISKFFSVFLVVELLVGIVNVLLGIQDKSISNIATGGLCVVIGLVFARVIYLCQKKIKKYLTEI